MRLRERGRGAREMVVGGRGGRMLRGGFTVHVDRDPDSVFAYLVDIERTPQWRDNVTEVTWIDEGEVRPGRRMRVVTSFAWWRDVTMTGQVTHHDPDGRRFSYEVVEGAPARLVNEYRVEPDGSGALVTMEGASEVRGLFLHVAGTVIERLYGRMLRPQVERLKVLLEQRADLGGSAQ